MLPKYFKLSSNIHRHQKGKRMNVLFKFHKIHGFINKVLKITNLKLALGKKQSKEFPILVWDRFPMIVSVWCCQCIKRRLFLHKRKPQNNIYGFVYVPQRKKKKSSKKRRENKRMNNIKILCNSISKNIEKISKGVNNSESVLCRSL